MRISDWSSDVCSSDLITAHEHHRTIDCRARTKGRQNGTVSVERLIDFVEQVAQDFVRYPVQPVWPFPARWGGPIGDLRPTGRLPLARSWVRLIVLILGTDVCVANVDQIGRAAGRGRGGPYG